MPVELKDYYATLGVSRDASEDDIKKAFRKLARKYHPDVATDKKAAEERFKEINEAYEVLGDPAKRRKYDQLGARWKEGIGAEAAGGAAAGGRPPFEGAEGFEYHFGGTGFSDFFEQFFSGGDRFEYAPGAAGGRAGAGGSRVPHRGGDIEGDILVALEEAVRGSIRTVSLEHVDPRTGHRDRHSFKVRIPIGVQEGQTIRVAGKGQTSPGGGPPGDLFLRVRLAAHPDFRARGSDLYHDLDVAPWEALLGATIQVPTLEGSVSVRIPPGTQNGQQMRVRGRGLPAARTGEAGGDLYVTVQVVLPREIGSEERALWEKLREVSPFHPRAAG